MSIAPQTFLVGDFIETPGHTAMRLYSIEGIHLGALLQEDVIELASVDRSQPDAHGKKQLMFVPKEMLEAGILAQVFIHTRVEDGK